MIFWNIPERCFACRDEYREGNKRPPCEYGKECVLTKRVRDPLNYEEFVIFNDLIDYIATGQLLTRDRRKREIIVALKPKLEEFKRMLKELEEKR